MTVPTLPTHEIKLFKKGTKIIRAGEKPAAAYLIKDGIIRIYKEHAGKEYDIAKLGAGQIMGEMALLSHRYHALHAEALTDVEAFIIRPEEFEAALRKTDILIKVALETLLDRIHLLDKAIGENDD